MCSRKVFVFRFGQKWIHFNGLSLWTMHSHSLTMVITFAITSRHLSASFHRINKTTFQVEKFAHNHQICYIQIGQRLLAVHCALCSVQTTFVDFTWPGYGNWIQCWVRIFQLQTTFFFCAQPPHIDTHILFVHWFSTKWYFITCDSISMTQPEILRLLQYVPKCLCHTVDNHRIPLFVSNFGFRLLS